MLLCSKMAPPLEGTHTTLYLFCPIREQSCINLYAPPEGGQSFIALPHSPISWCHELRREGSGSDRGGAYVSGGVVQRDCSAEPKRLMVQQHGDQKARVRMENQGPKIPGEMSTGVGDVLIGSGYSLAWPLQAPVSRFFGPQQENGSVERAFERDRSPSSEPESLEYSDIALSEPGTSWSSDPSLEPLLLGFKSDVHAPGSGDACGELWAGWQHHSRLNPDTLNLEMSFCPPVDISGAAAPDLEGCCLPGWWWDGEEGGGATGGSVGVDPLELQSSDGWGEALAGSPYAALCMESLGEYGEWEEGDWSPLLEMSSIASALELPHLPPDSSLRCDRNPSRSQSAGQMNTSPSTAPPHTRPSQHSQLLPHRSSEEEEGRGEETAVSVCSRGSCERNSPAAQVSVRSSSSPVTDKDFLELEDIWPLDAGCETVRPKHPFFPRVLAPEYDIISPSQDRTVHTPVDPEEWTPGRLQAVWPPPRPKDEEEKVGLKYTEAEHQAALLQLKRESKEDKDKLRVEFDLQVFQIRGEHAVSLSQLEETIAELQRELADIAAQSRADCREVGVSTEDDNPPKSFRTVCVQTDRETFIKSPEEERRPVQSADATMPTKLDLTSISQSLMGKVEPATELTPPLTPSPPLLSQAAQVPPPLFSLPGSVHSPQFLLAPSLPESAPPPAPPLPECALPPAPPLPRCVPPPAPPLPGCGPPPAPPLPGCGYPAPPPPPGGNSFPSPVLRAPRKRVVEPACAMKPLYWNRIQLQDNSCASLWGSLEEPHLQNLPEFEELFSRPTTLASRKPLCQTYEKRTKPKQIIKLLDGKRSQSVGILISSVHLEMKDIRQAVMMADNSVVDLETLEALYENRAQNDELDKIRKHFDTCKEDEVKLLDKPEQFLYELAQIPDFSERAHAIIFQAAYSDGMSSIRRKVEIVSDVCKVLLDRSAVRDVMGLILAFGNHMNGGNRTRGQADGFGLEILPKLKDVKSRDKRMSLLDYLASYYLRNIDQDAGTDRAVFPLPEPEDLLLAAQVKFEEVSGELKRLHRELMGCEKLVQKVCLRSLEENLQPFKQKMEAFISAGKDDHRGMCDRLTSAQNSFQDMVQYFGLRPKCGEKDLTPDLVFNLWFEFCRDFKSAWKREMKIISRERAVGSCLTLRAGDHTYRPMSNTRPLKAARESVKLITEDRKVGTRRSNPNSLKERLRLKEAILLSR